MSSRRTRAVISKESARGEKFPLKGKDYAIVCDGAPMDDDTYTIRILINNISTAADARKAATWLMKLVSSRMPKGFVTGKGVGEVKG